MKKAMEWKEEYNIGILRIDHQHRYFLELINWLTDNLLYKYPKLVSYLL